MTAIQRFNRVSFNSRDIGHITGTVWKIICGVSAVIEVDGNLPGVFIAACVDDLTLLSPSNSAIPIKSTQENIGVQV